jgi:hypothetical protein
LIIEFLSDNRVHYEFATDPKVKAMEPAVKQSGLIIGLYRKHSRAAAQEQGLMTTIFKMTASFQ